jgi:hypothetical protein
MPATQRGQSRSQRIFLVPLGIGIIFLAILLIPLLTQVRGLLILAIAAVGGISALWMVYRPYWGVLAIIAAMIIDIDPIGIPGLGIPYLVSMVLLLPLTLRMLRDREIWVWRLPQIRLLCLIGTLFVISLVWNYYRFTLFSLPPEAVRMLTIFFSRLAFLVFFLYFINTRERIEWSVWLILALVVFLALHALEDFVIKGDSHGHFSENRAHASFSLAANANRLAYISLFATCLLWFYYSHGKAAWWGKFFIFPLFFLLPLTTFTTGSRSGLLQTLLLGAFIFKEQKGWSIVQRVRTFLLLGLAGLVAVMAVPSRNITRATSFDPTVETPGQASLRNRIAVDLAAIQIALTHPFLGVGLSNFSQVERVTPGLGTESKTSNAYTWALTSGGIGVLTLYMLLHLLTYRTLRRLESSGPPEFLWLSKGLKVNLFLFLLFSVFTDFWLSDFFYFLLVLPISLTLYWQRQSQHSRQFQAALARMRSARLAAMRQHRPAPQVFSPSPSTSS